MQIKEEASNGSPVQSLQRRLYPPSLTPQKEAALHSKPNFSALPPRQEIKVTTSLGAQLTLGPLLSSRRHCLPVSQASTDADNVQWHFSEA